MVQEIKVQSGSPMPKGYVFLAKGICYKTLYARKWTHESKRPLYIVYEGTTPIGLRAPRYIITKVHIQAKETLPTRRAAVQRRDDQDISRASAEIDKHFPCIPKADKEKVLKHGFRKFSGRVGRTGRISLEKKVVLAVWAHVRHCHSEYEALLNSGVGKEDARRRERKGIAEMMRGWGWKGDKRRT